MQPHGHIGQWVNVGSSVFGRSYLIHTFFLFLSGMRFDSWIGDRVG